MRKLVALLSVLASPVMAAAPPLCALPAPAVMPPALRVNAGDTSPSKPSQPQPALPSGPPLPAALANIPFAPTTDNDRGRQAFGVRPLPHHRTGF